jgi:hypothetical protein
MFSKLATELKLKVEKCDGRKEGDIRLTCCKMNNISVCVEVWIYHNTKEDWVNIGLKIETCMAILGNDGDIDNHSLYCETIVKEVKSNEINYEEFYEKVYAIIPTLKISKIKGKFLTADDVSDELCKLFTHPNVELTTCCVCLDMCGGVFIRCGHNICIECIDKLKSTKDEDDDDDDCSYSRCPLCREKIAS